MPNEKSLANLRPKKKGDKCNPGAGRPKGKKNRRTLLKKWLDTKMEIENPVSGEKTEGILEDQVVLALINAAINGDVGAIKEVFDTRYGMKTTKVNPIENSSKINLIVSTELNEKLLRGAEIKENE